jgi:Na+/H+ antiporter NhaD/arsenite permease-like protein
MPTLSFYYLATLLFIGAIIHIFLTGTLHKLSKNYQQGTFLLNMFQLLGEVEIVFGLWSAIFISISFALYDFNFIINYLNTCIFTEAIFVFVIMSVCSTGPILNFFEKGLINLSHLIPIDKNLSSYISILFFGSLLGSFITEPAAMTICAYLLLPRFFTSQNTQQFKYATLALLFVNISLGGTITPYAAPPILMVAKIWHWDLSFMLSNFAPKTILTLMINTAFITALFKKEILLSKKVGVNKRHLHIPSSITFTHLVFLLLIILSAHYSVLFVGLFLFFIGFLRATKEYQSPLKLREPLLVGFFLAGLIVLGGLQKWWLTPLISQLSSTQLFFGSIGLTAFTDNAALTYLGTLVPTMDLDSQLALVSGSVIGGGLTVIANAPNPAGLGILRVAFEEKGFSAMKLFLWAAPLTMVAIIIFFFKY